jgi:hypothetical protein
MEISQFLGFHLSQRYKCILIFTNLATKSNCKGGTQRHGASCEVKIVRQPIRVPRFGATAASRCPDDGLLSQFVNDLNFQRFVVHVL